jgi:hypothetical protein
MLQGVISLQVLATPIMGGFKIFVRETHVTQHRAVGRTVHAFGDRSALNAKIWGFFVGGMGFS